MEKSKILYVDDEKSNLIVFEQLMRREFEIVTHQDAEKVLNELHPDEFDLVLSDQKMLNIDGIEFLRKFKEKSDKHIPSILISAFSDADVLKKAINQVQIEQFVSKPFDADNLESIIKLLIHKSKLEKANKQYRLELELSEKKYRNILNNMAEVWVRISFTGVIELVNPAVKKHLGYEPEEIIGKSILPIYSNVNEREALLKELRQTKKPRRFVKMLHTKNGVKKVFSVTSVLVYNDEGVPIAIESLMHEVTKEIRLKQELKQRNTLIQESQKMANFGNLEWRPASKFISISTTLGKILGLENEECNRLLFSDFLKFFYPRDRSDIEKVFDRAISSTNGFGLEVKFKNRRGNLKFMRIWGKALMLEKVDGVTKSIVAACMDITKEKEDKLTLIESKNDFEVLSEESPSYIFRITKDLKLAYANTKAYRLIKNIKEKNQTGIQSLNKLIENKVAKAVYEVYDEEVGQAIELFLPDQNKLPIWLEVSFSPIRKKGKVDGVLMIMRDTTKLKEAEDLLRDSNKQLEEKVRKRTIELENAKVELELAYEKEKKLSEMKSRFVATASHQFRTPLTVIQSSIGLLDLYLKKIEHEGIQDKFDEIVSRIVNEIERMTIMMDDVLILEKKESGKLELNLKEIDLVDILEKIVSRFNQIHEQENYVDLTITGKPRVFQSDEKVLENIFSNLLSNAIKYSQNSLKKPRVECNFDPKFVELKVIDYGIGIPLNEQDQIFEPFYRASNAKDLNGTGLGMAIVKSYANLINADLLLRSEPNEGSTFILKFDKSNL